MIRLKINAKYGVIKAHKVLTNKGVISDQAIRFTGIQTARKCSISLRRIHYHDAVTDKNYVFQKNNFKLAARTIADIVGKLNYSSNGSSNT